MFGIKRAVYNIYSSFCKDIYKTIIYNPLVLELNENVLPY